MHICIQFAISSASDEQTNSSNICPGDIHPVDKDDKTGSWYVNQTIFCILYAQTTIDEQNPTLDVNSCRHSKYT